MTIFNIYRNERLFRNCTYLETGNSIEITIFIYIYQTRTDIFETMENKEAYTGSVVFLPFCT